MAQDSVKDTNDKDDSHSWWDRFMIKLFGAYHSVTYDDTELTEEELEALPPEGTWRRKWALWMHGSNGFLTIGAILMVGIVLVGFGVKLYTSGPDVDKVTYSVGQTHKSDDLRITVAGVEIGTDDHGEDQVCALVRYEFNGSLDDHSLYGSESWSLFDADHHEIATEETTKDSVDTSPGGNMGFKFICGKATESIGYVVRRTYEDSQQLWTAEKVKRGHGQKV